LSCDIKFFLLATDKYNKLDYDPKIFFGVSKFSKRKFRRSYIGLEAGELFAKRKLES
jgi:hypothetical protein